MTTHFFGDTAVLTERSLRHITRSPDTIITTVLTPIAMMLMFVYVFGGAINTGSDSYVSYQLPGILLITIASGISYTAFRLFLDMQTGIFERFQSMPIARSSVLWAHVLTSLVANLVALVLVVLVAFLMGFRTSAGVTAWLEVAGILILFTLALTWLAVIPGLTATSATGASGFAYPLIFLPFVSSAFVPTDDHARPRARFRGEPAGDLDRQLDPRPVHPEAGRQRHVGRPRLVRRHSRRRVHPRDTGLPTPDRGVGGRVGTVLGRRARAQAALVRRARARAQGMHGAPEGQYLGGGSDRDFARWGVGLAQPGLPVHSNVLKSGMGPGPETGPASAPDDET